jgi:hypothetical protein
MNRNLVVSDELTVGGALLSLLSLLFQANMPSKTVPALADTRIVGLGDQIERMAAIGFSPGMAHPDQDASVFFRQSLGEDSQSKQHLPGL